MSKMSGAQKDPGWILAQVQEGVWAALGDVKDSRQPDEQFADSQKLCLVFCYSLSLL